MKNKGQLKDKTAKINDFKKVKSRKSSLQKDLREMKLVEIRGFEMSRVLVVTCCNLRKSPILRHFLKIVCCNLLYLFVTF